MNFKNQCLDQAINALSFLAKNPRPSGGNDQYNSEHLLQIVSELKESLHPKKELLPITIIDTMTEQEIKERIAVIDGWTYNQEGYWISPDGIGFQVMRGWNTHKDGTDIIPDYFSKEEILPVVDRHIKDKRLFIQELVEMVDEEYHTDDMEWPSTCDPIDITIHLMFNMSGKDYCKAFIRCMNNEDQGKEHI